MGRPQQADGRKGKRGTRNLSLPSHSLLSASHYHRPLSVSDKAMSQRLPLSSIGNKPRIDAYFGARKRSGSTAAADDKVKETRLCSSPSKRPRNIPETGGAQRVSVGELVLGPYLGRLPTEILFAVYKRSEAEGLARLALSSKGLATSIRGWLGEAPARRRLIATFAGDQPVMACDCCGRTDAEMEPTLLAINAPRASVFIPHHRILQAHYWGLVMKAVSCLRPTKERIQFCRELAERTSAEALPDRQPFLLYAWGRILITMVSNWAYKECDVVFEMLVEQFGVNLATRLGAVTPTSFDTHPSVFALAFFNKPVQDGPQNTAFNPVFEHRLFLRGMILDHLLSSKAPPNLLIPPIELDPSKDAAYWILRVMTGMEVMDKGAPARLLFYLYAPIHHRYRMGKFPVVDHSRLCSHPVRTISDAKRELGQYAWALESLAVYGNTVFAAPAEGQALPIDPHTLRPLMERNFSPAKLFSLVEELTTYPEPWALDNFAALLLLSPRCAATVLSLRVVHNSIDEAATIINAAKNVGYFLPSRSKLFKMIGWYLKLAYRWGMVRTLESMVTRILDKVPSTATKARLMAEVLHTGTRSHLLELLSFPNAASFTADFREELNAQAVFNPIFRAHLFRLY